MFKIAIDLMGGDNAPKQPIKGIESFIKSNLSNDVFFYVYKYDDNQRVNIQLFYPRFFL